MASASVTVIGVNVLFCLLSCMTAATRLQRTVTKIRTLQAHDVMLVAALICGITEAVLQCIETRYGLGQINGGVKVGSEVLYTKLHMSLLIAYLACNMFVKLSLLLFYRALSRDNKYFYVLCFMGVVATLFGMSCIFVIIFQCSPISKAWNPAIDGQCINIEAFYYANGGFMIGNDLILYILPILIVREVQLSRAKAAAMNVLFALGFVVVVASCMRLVAVHSLFTNPSNTLYYDAMLLIWCTIENHLAIIIICLPAVKAALVTLAPSLRSMPSSFWSNIVPRRKSSVAPCPLELSANELPSTPVKRGSSWFSFGASTVQSSSHKSKGSLASMSPASIFKPNMSRVQSDEVRLQKLPSISVHEDRDSFSAETDQAHFAQGGPGAYTAYPVPKDHV